MCEWTPPSQSDFESLARELAGARRQGARHLPLDGDEPVHRGVLNLGKATLVTPKSRVVLEKPLGEDRASADKINALVGSIFDEKQIYRIDHYLGKEAVQNLIALRFGNALFEPLWRRGRISHVQITVAETARSRR